MIEHGKDSPWAALFGSLARGTVVVIDVPGWDYSGQFDGTASWENQDETVRFHGVILVDELDVSSWIPYDAIFGVSLP